MRITRNKVQGCVLLEKLNSRETSGLRGIDGRGHYIDYF